MCCWSRRLHVDWLLCTSTRTNECLKNVDTESLGYLGDQMMDGGREAEEMYLWRRELDVFFQGRMKCQYLGEC